jgi:hypothetical protein
VAGEPYTRVLFNLRSSDSRGFRNPRGNHAVTCPVRRPTQGVVLGNGFLKLLPTDNYDPNDEHWEFVPGSIVRAKEVRNVDGTYLLAVAQKGS